jgi:hypothetical protein
VDLSRGLDQPFTNELGIPAHLSPEAPGEFENLYLAGFGESSGGFKPLVTTAAAPYLHGRQKAQFVGATPDLSHVVFQSPAALTANATEAEGLDNLYEWTSGGGFQLVTMLPAGESLKESVVSLVDLGAESEDTSHAISDDGSRVIWSARVNYEQGGLYESDMATGETVKINATQGPAAFQTASSNGLRVFFTAQEPGNGNQAGNDLYMFDASTGEPTDLTPDHNSADPQGASVQGVLGASEDGSYVYVAATGDLAPGARSGEVNLYLLHYDGTQWTTTFVSPGVEGQDFMYRPLESTARVSPNGRYVAFISHAKLTGYGNASEAEVYLYDASTGRLTCASCNPTGARPAQAGGTLPGWTPMDIYQTAYQSRYLSNEGRLFFDSGEPLVPQDTNGEQDVYEYEPDGLGSCGLESGCIYLISSGVGSSDSTFVDASASGDDVFFVAKDEIVPQDTDDAFDMYDAHVCTAAAPCFAEAPATPPACTSSDACKPGPTPQPAIFGAPASATFSGAGNAVTPASKAPVKTQKTKKLKKGRKKEKRRKRRKAHRSLSGQARR